MEIILILVGVALVVATYFFAGAIVRFTWDWWITALFLFIAVVVFVGLGTVGAAIAVAMVLGSIFLNNAWQSTNTYLRVSKMIDKLFLFDD